MRKVILWLSIAGALFSGFLSWQFSQGLCAGGCQLLLGLPTCVYGLTLFLLILTALAVQHQYSMHAVLGIASAGVLFSLVLAIIELRICLFCWQLGLPNCVYGFVVFLAIAILAYREMRKS